MAIPCDVPTNTTFLLLANAGLTGSFSFQTLLERVPSLFCNSTFCLTVGLVDMSGNSISGVESLPSPSAFWADFQLNAYLDLSGNNIAMLQKQAFEYAVIVGPVNLTGNQISSVGWKCFANAHIQGGLDLSGNSITDVATVAFMGATVNSLPFNSVRFKTQMSVVISTSPRATAYSYVATKSQLWWEVLSSVRQSEAAST